MSNFWNRRNSTFLNVIMSPGRCHLVLLTVKYKKLILLETHVTWTLNVRMIFLLMKRKELWDSPPRRSASVAWINFSSVRTIAILYVRRVLLLITKNLSAYVCVYTGHPLLSSLFIVNLITSLNTRCFCIDLWYALVIWLLGTIGGAFKYSSKVKTMYQCITQQCAKLSRPSCKNFTDQMFDSHFICEHLWVYQWEIVSHGMP